LLYNTIIMSLFSQPAVFGEKKQCNFDHVNEFCISRAAVVDRFVITYVKLLHDTLYQNYWNRFLFDWVIKQTTKVVLW